MRVSVRTGFVAATIGDGFGALNHQMTTFLFPFATKVAFCACWTAFEIEFAIELVGAFINGAKPSPRGF